MSLERKTPLKRKRATPRKVKLPLFTCAKQRCNNPIRFFGKWCAKHTKEEADRLFSLYIRRRDGYCQVKTCGTPADLQCAHINSRGYFCIRWAPDNAVTLCSGHHVWYTNNPIEWDDWCIERMGQEEWEALRFRARRGGMPDLGIVVEELRTLMKEVAA